MLTLTRRINESIMIDDNIIIKVSAIKGAQVRLSIEAPKSMHILRDEIYWAVKKEKK